MSHTDIYERILEELEGGEMNELQRTIFATLRKSYPSGQTRRQLIQACYGYTPAEEQDLNNSSHDRKIRVAIADMFDHGIPVIATSGEPGYRIDITEESIKAMIAEQRSRRDRADKKIEAAENLLTKIRSYGTGAIPATVRPQPKKVIKVKKNPVQLSYLGGRQ